MNNTAIFKRTHDCWYGNYDNDEVKLIYHGDILQHQKNSGEVPLYRVSVWGNDDFGMTFDTTDENEAKELYILLSEKPFIDKEYLQSLKFNIF